MNIVSRAAIAASILAAAAVPCFAQDTVSHLTDAQGREVIVRTGMPAPQQYGPKPAFAALDSNHDGAISREEAEAFPPLANDFDLVAHNGERISTRQYAQWDYR
ncbi:MAG: hypothetical protein JSS42_11850 [Proteobacteria bacterium]|uniref:EF-hand domain-containing protein n=1 Tax=Rudaea sp. TaxID=2136325 RepID=UPI00321FAC2C|nr:hypothetical protein [Pseudomonadota bacterium]